MNEGIKVIQKEIKYLEREIKSQSAKRYQHRQTADIISAALEKDAVKLADLQNILSILEGESK